MPNTKYSLESVVPSTYLTRYKGKFQTFDQVYAVFGKKVRPMTSEEKANEYVYYVQTPDELAALLAFLNDQKQSAQNRTVEIHHGGIHTLAAQAAGQSSRISKRSTDLATETFEKTIYDNKIFWIKGYVTIDYVPRVGTITKTTARSALLGVTVGHTWKPVPPRITVLSKVKRKVIFAGELTTEIFVRGVGKVMTENIEGTMLVQSIPLIEGPCKTCS
ncbi:small-conductance mechanosensitive channel [Paenibacillus popilliae ATCC 14706]|uniref:Small-conductance mechanosensitive channel n=2 Tax=Paenibacillus popilliae TaxID=78057 RepID=M9LRZ7_PAEPP|nr:small-conductance mechanosensitive channel [Paenibacillus popilliae ATCC 14706]